MHDSHEPPWTHLLNCWKIPSPSVAALHPFFLRKAARQHQRGNFMGNFQMGHGTRSLWVISSLATQHISLEFCKTTASREKKPTVYSLSSGRLGCWIERTTLLLHSWKFPIPDLRECMGKWEKDSEAKLAGCITLYRWVVQCYTNKPSGGFCKILWKCLLKPDSQVAGMQLCSTFFKVMYEWVPSMQIDFWQSSTSLHPCCNCEAATKLWEMVEAADECDDDPMVQLYHKFFGNLFGEGFTTDFHQKPGTFCGIPPTETLLWGEVVTSSYLQSTLIQKVVHCENYWRSSISASLDENSYFTHATL